MNRLLRLQRATICSKHISNILIRNKQSKWTCLFRNFLNTISRLFLNENGRFRESMSLFHINRITEREKKTKASFI